MEYVSSRYLFLPSSASSAGQGTLNKITNYRTQLPTPTQLPSHLKYEVGVASISLPSSLHNVHDGVMLYVSPAIIFFSCTVDRAKILVLTNF